MTERMADEVTNVNRMIRQEAGSAHGAPEDPLRHALERRVDYAKQRIAADLSRAFVLVRRGAHRTERTVGRLAIFAGLVVVAALGVAFALVRRQTRARVRFIVR